MPKHSIHIFIIILLLVACKHSAENAEKNPLLLADREASVGWVILKIYEDSTFEYTTSGRRNMTDYSGHVEIRNDSLYFNYKDSIPAAGRIAVIKRNYVIYTAGSHKERIEIKLNKLK